MPAAGTRRGQTAANNHVAGRSGRARWVHPDPLRTRPVRPVRAQAKGAALSACGPLSLRAARSHLSAVLERLESSQSCAAAQALTEPQGPELSEIQSTR